MEIANSFTVPLPVERAWEVLLDVPRIAPCMPGAKLLSVDESDGSYNGEVSVRLGPVLLVLRGKATMTEVVPSEHRAVVRGEGRDTKGRGNASASICFTLVPEASETRVDIKTNLTLTGSVAQYARSKSMISDLAGHITTQFADNLRREIASMATSDVAIAVSERGSDLAAASGAGDRCTTSRQSPSDEQRGRPISGLRLGLWLIWRQIVRMFSAGARQ